MMDNTPSQHGEEVPKRKEFNNLGDLPSPKHRRFEIWITDASLGQIGGKIHNSYLKCRENDHVQVLQVGLLNYLSKEFSLMRHMDQNVQNPSSKVPLHLVTRTSRKPVIPSLELIDALEFVVEDPGAVRLWFSGDNFGTWYKVGIGVGEIRELQLNNCSIMRCQSPKLLLEIKGPTGWPLGDEMNTFKTASLEQNIRDNARNKKEKKTPSWRQALKSGSAVDIFDKQLHEWREGVVVEAQKKDLIIRFRGELGHRIRVSRNAGKSAGNDEVQSGNNQPTQESDTFVDNPKHGDVAKAYTFVHNWRSGLKQGMDVEVLLNTKNAYYCAENDTVLHFVLNTDNQGRAGIGRWWLSRREWDHTLAVNTNDTSVRGYLRSGCCLLSKCPPASRILSENTAQEEENASDGVGWELWNSHPWQKSPMVQVTIDRGDKGADGTPERPTVIVTVDDDLHLFKNFSEPEWQEPKWPVLLKGFYRFDPDQTWQRRRIDQIDSRRMAITSKLIQITQWNDGPKEKERRTTRRWAQVPEMVSLHPDPMGDEMAGGVRELRSLQLRRTDIDAGMITSEVELETARQHLLHKVVGLPNFGNTSYLNSILQCLLSFPEVVSPLVDPRSVRGEQNTTSPTQTDMHDTRQKDHQQCEMGGMLSHAFSALLRLLARTQHLGVLDDVYNMPKIGTHQLGVFGRFKSVLDQYCHRFRARHPFTQGEELDPMDAYNSILDMLHNIKILTARGDSNSTNVSPISMKNKSIDSGCTNSAKEKTENDTENKCLQHCGSKSFSTVVDIFEGQLCNKWFCPNRPSEQSSTFQKFRQITLPLRKPSTTHPYTSCSKNSINNKDAGMDSIGTLSNQAGISQTLSGCLRKFLQVKKAVHSQTEKVAEHTFGNSKIDLVCVPRAFCFRLKRFSCDKKIHHPRENFVDFPLEIFLDTFITNDGDTKKSRLEVENEIEKQMTNNTNALPGDIASLSAWLNGQILYELIAVLNHIRNPVGHYTTYTKRGSTWYLCDDDKVSEVNFDSIRTSKAYLLFYRKIASDKIDKYMRTMLQMTGVDTQDMLTSKALRTQAWEIRQNWSMGIKSKLEAEAKVEARKARLKAIHEATQNLQVQIVKAQSLLIEAVIDSISVDAINDFQNQILKAEKVGVKDDTLLSKAYNLLKSMTKTAEAIAEGTLIDTMSKKALNDLIISAGLFVKDDDASLENLRKSGRQARQRIIDSRNALVQLIVVPGAYDTMLIQNGNEIKMERPFEGGKYDVVQLPAGIQPGDALLRVIPKPVDQLSKLCDMGLSNDDVSLKALLQSQGDVQAAIDTMFGSSSLADVDVAEDGDSEAEQQSCSTKVHARFHIPFEIAKEYTPGQILVVNDPFNAEGTVLRHIPKSWRPGKDLLIPFRKPDVQLKLLRKKNFMDEAECLQALQDAHGTYRVALAKLRMQRKNAEHQRRSASKQYYCPMNNDEGMMNDIICIEHSMEGLDVVPGGEISIKNPYNPSEVRIVRVPEDWVQGTSILNIPFHSPPQLEVLMILGHNDNQANLKALKYSAGDIFRARQYLQHLEEANMIDVQFTGHEHAIKFSQAGDTVSIDHPFCMHQLVQRTLPPYFCAGKPFSLKFRKPAGLESMKAKWPAFTEALMIAALKKAQGDLPEAKGILVLIYEMLDDADDFAKRLSPAALIELLSKSQYSIERAKIYLTVGKDALEQLGAGNIDAFNAAWNTKKQAALQKKRQRASDFFKQVRETTDAMGLTDVTVERVQKLVQFYGYKLEDVIDALFAE